MTMAWKILLIVAPLISAECWLRSDGIEICDEDNVGWLAVWWFWFALLFFLCTCTGGGYYYQRREAIAIYPQGFITYSEPFLDPESKRMASSQATTV